MEEVLGGGLQKEDLVVVVAMVGKIAALLADELVVQTAVSNVDSAVIWTQVLFEALWVLLVGLLKPSVELLLGKGGG